MTNTSEDTLYSRLGGYDVVTGIVDEFLERLASDPTVGYYWAADSLDTKRRDRQLIVDFLAEAAGGTSFYTGRDMKTSHIGLGITDAEYDVLMEHCVGSMEKLGIENAEKGEVCAFVNSLRDQIVEDRIVHVPEQ